MDRRAFMRRGAAGVAALGGLATEPQPCAAEKAPAKLVVLTFDDAVKSHRTFVAPLLKELGFGATFFVTHRWMDDPEQFMTWAEIAELHRLGFEIGNHSWTHPNFGSPKVAARMAAELALVDRALGQVGVPRPSSFAFSGNGFGPEAVQRLAELGYRFARRGAQPEVPYGQAQVGPAFDPHRHHPLLVPTTGDAYPDWTLAHFRRVVAGAQPGQVVVLQFHGVPDVAHPWVHTPPERFREYMACLKADGFRCIALRELEAYVDRPHPPDDPTLKQRHPQPGNDPLELPVEVQQTRADLGFWLPTMLVDHRYSLAEAAPVAGMTVEEVRERLPGGGPPSGDAVPPPAAGVAPSPVAHPLLRALPYPGGRHPRAGFREGAIDPLRGTKVSLFPPWEAAGYVVVDLPEAVFSNLGLTFLAHTHIPTVWDDQNVVLENVDWERRADGSLHHQRTLPNRIALGAAIRPDGDGARMDLWLRNDTEQALTGLRTQVCVMLAAAPGFEAATNENKILRSPVAATRSADGRRWILTAWERCGRAWGNPPCPCMHADPVFPDCPEGETVRLRGRLRFYEGDRIDHEIERLAAAAR
jgi:peptidoglycan/xylan/chitin deacetylase (PgdA/CDA1 family)